MSGDRNFMIHEELVLPRFDDSEKPVEYKKLLGKGGEGVVVSATINKKEYALKFVSSLCSSFMSKCIFN